jgi:hypothetical protein
MEIRITGTRVAVVGTCLVAIFTLSGWLWLAPSDRSTPAMPIEVALAEIISPGEMLARHKDAESSLAAVDPEIVLTILLDVFLKVKPNSYRPDYMWSDSGYDDAPADWRAWISVNRVWRQAAGRDREFAGKLLVNKLKLSRDSEGTRTLIGYLKSYWCPDAEKTVVAMLRDSSSTLEIQLASADCLIYHDVEYYSEIRKFTLDLHAMDSRQRRIKSKFLQLILDRSNAPIELCTQQDSEVLHAAAEHLLDLRENGSRSSNSSRMFAIVDSDQFAKYLGGYVGIAFEPSVDDPSYSAIDGQLDPGIISDNAVRWWRRYKFESER